MKPGNRTQPAMRADLIRQGPKSTPEQTAKGLKAYLEARRQRVGFTVEDLKQAPDFMK